MTVSKEVLVLEAKKELARRDFFSFCNLTEPNFYRKDRPYIVELCNEFQEFYESDDQILVINMPPRLGKSRTAGKFVQWTLGSNSSVKVMTGSYNEKLSTTFSKSVRNTIQTIKAEQDKIVYSDIFPKVKIQKGDASMNMWSLEGQGTPSYLATSPGGTATGFGANLLIIDDLIKNALEANNENVLEGHWEWLTNTMMSRLEKGWKIIIIMTRWATGDLAGRALVEFRNYRIRHISMKALRDDGTMLCEEVLSREDYEMKIKVMGAEIAAANYQQEPIDQKGRLYKSFKTYTSLPRDAQDRLLFSRICSYTDTADEGDDYLCNIIYGEYLNEAYVLDVYYTKEGMEVTEPELAKRLDEFRVTNAKVESNNGGRGFARNVRELLTRLKNNRCYVSWFHQSLNKKARILTGSTWVMEHMYFPVNWQDKWPEYYKDMNKYQREGKNAHDDAPDATTGVAEQFISFTGARIG